MYYLKLLPASTHKAQLRSANQLLHDKDLVVVSLNREIKEVLASSFCLIKLFQLQRLIAEVEYNKRQLEK